MFAGQEVLFSLMEIAIALAGFSAIVVSVRHRIQRAWTASDSDFFSGMIVHSICAALFSLLPTLLHSFTLDLTTSIQIAAPIMGVQILAHSIYIIRLPTTPTFTRIPLGVGTLVGASQFLVLGDVLPERSFAIYVAGVCWHLFHAGMLFVLLTKTTPSGDHASTPD